MEFNPEQVAAALARFLQQDREELIRMIERRLTLGMIIEERFKSLPHGAKAQWLVQIGIDIRIAHRARALYRAMHEHQVVRLGEESDGTPVVRLIDSGLRGKTLRELEILYEVRS